MFLFGLQVFFIVNTIKKILGVFADCIAFTAGVLRLIVASNVEGWVGVFHATGYLKIADVLRYSLHI